jgi:hydrogenase nickel incorporation protein HypA/HybF
MHESSIVEALLDRVADEASRYTDPRVTELTVRLGALAGVDVDLLRKAYEVFRERTLCRDAALVIELEPARWGCPLCGADLEPAGSRRCGRCHRPGRLLAGAEIVLQRVVMEVE